MDRIVRRLKHLMRSGCVVIGLEHFLVMFPSAMLVAKLSYTPYGAITELPEILLASGIGTLLFILLTRGAVPFFLGPSFAYIGFLSFHVAQISGINNVAQIRETIFLGYLISGIYLMALSFLYKYDIVKRIIKTIFPSTVMGPAISLIGLELANMAARDSGLIGDSNVDKMLSTITLLCIIVFSLLRHHFFQNASILIGVVMGCIIATVMGVVSWPPVSETVIAIPKLNLINVNLKSHNLITLAITVFPCAMIAFIESLGRIAVFEGMQKRDGINVEQSVLNKGIYMHSITNLLSSICMMPSAIYAENLAVMNLHNTETLQLSIREPDEDRFVNHCYTPYSIFPYIIASLICIIVAVISGLQSLLISIPLPILGGMELFVFSLIAAPGIQLLVEQQVNYKKISNQVITASVLLAGISNISFTYKSLALHGMSLGLTTGVMVNLIVLVLGYFGYLNERFSVIEIIDLCSDIFVNSVTLYCYGENGELTLEKRLDNKEIEKYVRRKDVASILKNSHMIRLVSETNRKEVGIIQEYGRICVKVKLQIRYSNRFLNDYPRVTVFNNASRIKTIVVDEYVSKRILTDILNNVD